MKSGAKWHPFRDDLGIVHWASKLTKRETEYIFRLAFTVSLIVGCEACKAKPGETCRRKPDGAPMFNHSKRVTHARALTKERYEPLFDRMHQPWCLVGSAERFAVHVPAPGCAVDCMACITRGHPSGHSNECRS